MKTMPIDIVKDFCLCVKKKDSEWVPLNECGSDLCRSVLDGTVKDCYMSLNRKLYGEDSN